MRKCEWLCLFNSSCLAVSPVLEAVAHFTRRNQTHWRSSGFRARMWRQTPNKTGLTNNIWIFEWISRSHFVVLQPSLPLALRLSFLGQSIPHSPSHLPCSALWWTDTHKAQVPDIYVGVWVPTKAWSGDQQQTQQHTHIEMNRTLLCC